MRLLGLQVRIVLALVAVAAGACWALGAATSEYVANDFRRQLEDRVAQGTTTDLHRVAEGLARHPRALTKTDLDLSSLPGSAQVGAKGVLIPLASNKVPIDLTVAEQYSFSESQHVLDRIPQCFQPTHLWPLENLEPGESQVWNQTCGEYVMGFGLLRTSEPGGQYGWLVVQALVGGAGMEPIPNPVPELNEVLTSASLYIIIGAVILAVLLAAMVAHPLTRARAMAEAVAAGDLDVRLPENGRDTVGRMSAAVNTMADRLTGQISELELANESQRRFVSDVAHELRTPTAALLASAEALEHPQSRDEAAVLVVPQLRRLAKLTEDLLEISRLDAGRAHLQPSCIDVMDLVNEVIDDSGSPESVQLVGSFPFQVSTDAARLRVIIRNLVANALQHGSPPATVTADRSNGHVTVSVTDVGKGVPPGLRERVFDRFVRGDEARHGSSSGLGLAIASEKARLLGGTLTLDEDGRTFLLNLPG